MALYEIGSLDVATTNQGDGFTSIEVIARSRSAEQHLPSADSALTEWHPYHSPDSVAATIPTDELGHVIDTIATNLPPLLGAALKRSHALHLADAATEEALNLVRTDTASKTDAARTLGVTRQTLDRWLGTWDRH